MKEPAEKKEQETKRKVRRMPKTQAAAAPEKKSQRETDDEKDVTFVAPKKNARSLNSSDRTEELIREAEDCKWDALLLCETWRPNKAEIWESRQGHMYMGAGTFDNKNGVAILLNRKLAQKNKSGSKHQRACLRNIDHSQQAANYVDGCLHFFPHGVCRPQSRKSQTPRKSCKIIGGDFNAELGPCIGFERLSVGPHALKESNSTGDWLKQWLRLQKVVALETICRTTPQKETKERKEKERKGKKRKEKERKGKKRKERRKKGERKEKERKKKETERERDRKRKKEKETERKRKTESDSSTKEERFSEWIQKMEEKRSNGEHQKSDEGRSESPKKLPGSRSATVNLKEKSCRELKPQQQHASRSKTKPQQPVSTLKDTTKQPQSQAKGNMKQQPVNMLKDAMKQPQPQTKEGMKHSAAKKTSDREDILRSQNNKNGRGEEEDDEIIALIDARRKIKREGKERKKRSEHKDQTVHQGQKNSRRQERIQRIFKEFQGFNNISNIKSAKKRTLIPKTKKTLTIVLAHSVILLLCLVTSFATLVTRTFRDRKIHGLIALLSGTSFSCQRLQLPSELVVPITLFDVKQQMPSQRSSIHDRNHHTDLDIVLKLLGSLTLAFRHQALEFVYLVQ